jgi:hypothetical protein
VGVGIYPDASGRPGTTPVWAGWFESNKLNNIPIQMNTGTSNWVRRMLRSRTGGSRSGV